jgi:hypothetical protein
MQTESKIALRRPVLASIKQDARSLILVQGGVDREIRRQISSDLKSPVYKNNLNPLVDELSNSTQF